MIGKGYRIDFRDVAVWKRYLQDHGFVVLANYLNSEECQQAMQQMWAIVEKLSDGRIRRDNVNSQQNSDNYYPMARGGMTSYIAHSQVQWDLRKRCRPIFEQLWQTKCVKSSFDQMCFMNGNRKMEPEPMVDFLHADQGGCRDYLWCYQGMICLTKNGPGEGGFVVVADSHLIHSEHIKNKGESYMNNSFYSCDNIDKKSKPFIDCFKVDNEAGDFILWDGRTFHGNTYPEKPVVRACCYICMIPAEQVDEETSKARHHAVDNRLTSTHHPGEGFNLFPRLSSYYYNKMPHLRQAVEEVNTFKMDPEIEALI